MTSPDGPLILSVDDDPQVATLLQSALTKAGYRAISAPDAEKALQILETTKPDVILLDILMPETDGYALCARLQQDPRLSYIPVIFLTALDTVEDRKRGLAAGAVDYISKPFSLEELLEKVGTHLKTGARWQAMGATTSAGAPARRSDFDDFKKFLFDELKLTPEDREKLSRLAPADMFTVPPALLPGVGKGRIAECLARFLGVTYVASLKPDQVRLGVLPAPFCRRNLVVPVHGGFVLTNPFDWDLLNQLRRLEGTNPLSIQIALPETITPLVREAPSPEEKPKSGRYVVEALGDAQGESPLVRLADDILKDAITQRASDIHIEPKEEETVVRFRIDGDLQDYLRLDRVVGLRAISRFKALGGLDITERRRPQDGSFSADIHKKNFVLRLATSSTPHGESLVIRFVEPGARPRSLDELGFTPEQAGIMIGFAQRSQGLILIVGPTGSGKTTTIYSLLSQIDCRTRSLMSVEDPVEYRIPFANQQQVNEKAGVTFESLLRSAVRQDPDILYLGEIRDPYSAKMSMDFASTGHLTITTLHTSNATTAVFRLERLGAGRESMGDSIVGIVAQRLLKKLCPHCRIIRPVEQREIALLSPFTDRVPATVAQPAGCSKCRGGYLGREGVYEILRFDPEIASMVRTGRSISEIRGFASQRGDYLISDHAIEKVRQYLISPADAHERVLVEEESPRLAAPVPVPAPAPKLASTAPPAAPAKETREKKSILVVEDDVDSSTLVKVYLEKAGYEVTVAQDPIEAFLSLGKSQYDLILSDLEMPNLDGFKLLEVTQQKGIATPVIFLTARSGEETEVKALELGAVDFIRKPFKKEILLLRVKSALKS